MAWENRKDGLKNKRRKRLVVVLIVCCAVFLLVLGVAGLIAWYVVLQANDVDYDLNELPPTERKIFIHAEELQALLNSETGATLIDARTRYNPIFERTKPGYGDSIDGSHRTPWKDYTVDGGRDHLKSVDEIEQIFRDNGVSNDVPVVVYGGWKEEWGEEGRIFWQLDWLNHTQAYILYGGIFAWTEGSFKGAGRRDAEGIQTLIKNNADVIIVDGRTQTEYNGDTPYGSARGGHIPTAVSYDWTNVFDPDGSGNLKSVKQLKNEFKKLGVRSKADEIIVYCTSGIRAGFLYSVFQWLGYESVANYASSYYMWSKDSNLPIEM